MIEELKIIMETIGQATGAAKQFGIFWLAIELLKVVFAYAIGAAALFGAIKISNRLISIWREDAFILTLRKMVMDNPYGSLTSDEKKLIETAVSRGSKRTE